jgi:hypothetical protein
MVWMHVAGAPHEGYAHRGSWHHRLRLEVPGRVVEFAVCPLAVCGGCGRRVEPEEENVGGKKPIVRERNREDVYRHLTFPEEVSPDEAEFKERVARTVLGSLMGSFPQGDEARIEDARIMGCLWNGKGAMI